MPLFSRNKIIHKTSLILHRYHLTCVLMSKQEIPSLMLFWPGFCYYASKGRNIKKKCNYVVTEYQTT